MTLNIYDKSKHGELYSLSTHVYIADRIYHDMVRDVASQLAERRSDLDLYFCAYINYCRPSENFKLTPNLTVMMAPNWRKASTRTEMGRCCMRSVPVIVRFPGLTQ